MQTIFNRRSPQAFLASAVLLGMAVTCNAQAEQQTTLAELGQQLEVGDVVFIRIPTAPFTKVADTTSSWTNHVGIVSDVSGAEPTIAESRVPLSGETTFSKFVKRSDAGRVAVSRLPVALDAQQQAKLKRAVAERNGVLYDTGFDLHSHRQFCSRYVREILFDAAGVELGEIENFSTLLKRNPQADQQFWRWWYFGNIPWQRETVTPASLLKDGKMRVVFDGRVQQPESAISNSQQPAEAHQMAIQDE
ncbi:MAG: YebB family permuted papain-like enzyme [Sideroxydans sp.]|nr:YebB family permuted papain-like enzyme [Sideroxydans sp.]